MLQDDIIIILALLFAVSLLVMIGQRLKISYPIFLVIGGLLISLVPGIPTIRIDPEIVFLLFLPPLLYEAAWFTSWQEFIRWWRPVSLLAFGLVFLTSLIVAYASQSMIPGFTLALGFLLGGIISPPDAVAATSVLKNISIPRRIVSILEGESLINDASSLIVFRFAVVAIMTGHFSLQQAVGQFFLAASAGIAIGVAIGQIMYLVHRYLPTTPSIDAMLTLMTPYFMYIAAEHFHFSGVMAVVSGGLFLSYRSHAFLRSGATRIQAQAVWSTVIFVLNGLVFILIGLELPVIISGLEGYSILEALGYALVVTLISIIVRILWVMPIAYVPKWINYTVRLDKVNPTWKGPLIVGWAGMRGVVSLASALSIPLLLPDGTAFPFRNLILFITFVVILVTLVFQGLTLPLVIKWVKIKEMDPIVPEDEQLAEIRLRLMNVAQEHLVEKYSEQIKSNELVGFLKKQLENDINVTKDQLNSLVCEETDREELETYNRVVLDLISVKREELFRLRKEKLFDDGVIRKQEERLDLDEVLKLEATLPLKTI